MAIGKMYRITSKRTYRKPARRPTVNKLVNKIKSSLGETKCFDAAPGNLTAGTPNSLIPQSITTSWCDTVMHPVEGSDSFNRIGRKISVIGLRFQGILANSWVITTGGDSYNIVRIIVAHWGTPANAASDLYALSDSINTTVRRDQHPNLIKKYFDKTYPLVPYTSVNTAAGSGPQLKKVAFFIKFKKPLVIQYTSTTANSNTSALMISYISDSSAVPNPGFVQASATMYYKDI